MDLQPTVRLYGFGGGTEILDTPESDGPHSYERSRSLLMSFDSLLRDETKLTLVYALARARIHSRRAWIQEGLAHFMHKPPIWNGNGGGRLRLIFE